MADTICRTCGGTKSEVITAYITKNGKRIYPVRSKVFRFFACPICRKN